MPRPRRPVPEHLEPEGARPDYVQALVDHLNSMAMDDREPAVRDVRGKPGKPASIAILKDDISLVAGSLIQLLRDLGVDL